MSQASSTHPNMLRRLRDYQQPLAVFVFGILLSFFLSTLVAQQLDRRTVAASTAAPISATPAPAQPSSPAASITSNTVLKLAFGRGHYSPAEYWLLIMVLTSGVLASTIAALLLAVSARLRTTANQRAFDMTHALRQREAQLEATLASLDDWVFLLDANGVVQDCHEPPTHSGWQARTNFLGHPFSHALPPLAAAEFTVLLRKAGQQGSASFEFELHSSAQRRHFLARLTRCHATPTFLIDGTTVVVRDITAERTQLNALRESEEKFRQFFTQAPHAILLAQQHHYADANPAALALLGIPSLTVLQHASLAVLSPHAQPDGSESLAALQSHMQNAREDGPQIFEWVLQRLSDGSTFPAELHTRYLQINGEDYFLSTITDLSPHKQNERLLIQARDEAQSAMVEKSDFLATMSHEIRTPMNGVLGMAQLLADTPLAPEQRDFLATIQQSGQSLLAIINDILDFSKIQAGKLSFEEMPFDLQIAMDEACELLLPQIREKNLSLTLNIDSRTPFHVIGDPGRFRQILLNYLSNAIKFTQHGNITVGLHVHDAGRGAALYELTVADTGIGVTPHKQDAIFQKFAQADSTATRRFGGTGLGLAICKALVERMGGEVSMSSVPGQGSIFRATFWMSVDANAAQHIPPALAPSLRDREVLLIDNASAHRDSVEQGLIHAGLSVMSAATLDNAKKNARLQSPHFIVLNAELLDGDNYADLNAEVLIKKLRDEPSMEKATLILLSSRPERHDNNFCRTHHIAAHLPKPARLAWLISSLNVLTSGEHNGIVTRQTLMAHHGRGNALPTLRSGVRILLAEDNTVNQKVAARMLEKMGCHIDLVGNGLEAIEMATQLPYDLILMDVQMPDMDGISATRHLRAHGFTALPIIALTANNRDADRTECRDAGMNDFLAKPIRYEDLHACLSRWL